MAINLEINEDEIVLRKGNKKVTLSIAEALDISVTLRRLATILEKKTEAPVKTRKVPRTSTTFSEFIRERRIDAKLSQPDVSDNFGYGGSQFISNWERGISKPPVEILKTIAKLYGCSANELFEEFLNNEIQIQKAKLHAEFYFSST